jgi:hypothetical protein
VKIFWETEIIVIRLRGEFAFTRRAPPFGEPQLQPSVPIPQS